MTATDTLPNQERISLMTGLTMSQETLLMLGRYLGVPAAARTAAAAAITATIAAVKASHEAGEDYQRHHQLTTQLASTRAELSEARTQRDQQDQAIGVALTDGSDPSRFEAAMAKTEARLATLQTREARLARLADEAAKPLADALREATRAALRQLAVESRQQAQAMAPDLLVHLRDKVQQAMTPYATADITAALAGDRGKAL